MDSGMLPAKRGLLSSMTSQSANHNSVSSTHSIPFLVESAHLEKNCQIIVMTMNILFIVDFKLSLRLAMYNEYNL